jgi:hypothetical protein
VNTLLLANDTAHTARADLTDAELSTIRSRYAGAIARGRQENTRGSDGELRVLGIQVRTPGEPLRRTIVRRSGSPFMRLFGRYRMNRSGAILPASGRRPS